MLPFLQAAIGSLALDTARSHQDEQLEKYGMDVLTVAFLAILITAPVGALAIGLAGPRLLQKAQTNNKKDEDGAEAGEEAEACEPSWDGHRQEYGPSALTLLSKHIVPVIFVEETKTSIGYMCNFKSSSGGVL